MCKRFNTSARKISKRDITNNLFYDCDTLPGSSGSPIIGRGDVNSNQAYCVKGIHIKSFSLPNTNAAQKIKELTNWINMGVMYLEECWQYFEDSLIQNTFEQL